MYPHIAKNELSCAFTHPEFRQPCDGPCFDAKSTSWDNEPTRTAACPLEVPSPVEKGDAELPEKVKNVFVHCVLKQAGIIADLQNEIEAMKEHILNLENTKKHLKRKNNEQFTSIVKACKLLKQNT
jgi:hypothetical protein